MTQYGKYIQELEKIYSKEGELTAKVVLKYAKDKKNVLHSFFDWNDSTASNKWREHQARMLINVAVVEVRGKLIPAFEVVSVSQDKKAYKSYSDIIDNEDFRQQIINRATKEIVNWKDTYQRYSEFKPIVKSINFVSKKLKIR